MFERRPFKSFQTNGTMLRSAVTKPTVSLCARSCCCLRPHLPPAPSLKPRRKDRGQPAAHAPHAQGTRGALVHGCSSHDGSYMRRSRLGCGHKHAPRRRETHERRQECESSPLHRDGLLPTSAVTPPLNHSEGRALVQCDAGRWRAERQPDPRRRTAVALQSYPENMDI